MAGIEYDAWDDELHLLSDEEVETWLARYVQPLPPELTQGPDMLDADAVAACLAIDPLTVESRYASGEIIGLQPEVGARVYPLTQFLVDKASSELYWPPAMTRVVATHGNGWGAWFWLMNERRDLGKRSALSCLRASDSDAVTAALDRDDEGAFC